MKQRSSSVLGFILFLTGSVAVAQGPPPAQGGNPPPPPQAPAPQQTPPPQQPRLGPAWAGAPQPAPRPEAMPQPGRPPMERAMGRWWNNPEMVEKLGVTADQKKKMEDIFQQHRLKLIDLNASLQKAEVTMEPLMAADQPDEAKIVAQIDRVAQARAELEKANARMLLGIRQVLTPEQWKKLQEERPAPAPVPGPAGTAPRPARR